MSTSRTALPPHVHSTATASRVSPGVGPVNALSSRSTALSNEDFPGKDMEGKSTKRTRKLRTLLRGSSCGMETTALKAAQPDMAEPIPRRIGESRLRALTCNRPMFQVQRRRFQPRRGQPPRKHHARRTRRRTVGSVGPNVTLHVPTFGRPTSAS